jgi:hypothetical protein
VIVKHDLNISKNIKKYRNFCNGHMDKFHELEVMFQHMIAMGEAWTIPRGRTRVSSPFILVTNETVKMMSILD